MEPTQNTVVTMRIIDTGTEYVTQCKVQYDGYGITDIARLIGVILANGDSVLCNFLNHVPRERHAEIIAIIRDTVDDYHHSVKSTSILQQKE